MATLTLEHLTPSQRSALHAAPPASPANRFDALAVRLQAASLQARMKDQPLYANVLRGYAGIAAELATLDLGAEQAA